MVQYFCIFNNQLEKFNLQSFVHRNLLKLLNFVYKIYNNVESPKNLKNKLIIYNNNENNYQLRNKKTFYVPNTGNLNKYGERTFNYVFPILLNKFCLNDLNLSYNLYKIRMFNNINLNYINFIKYFEKYDLKYIY